MREDVPGLGGVPAFHDLGDDAGVEGVAELRHPEVIVLLDHHHEIGEEQRSCRSRAWPAV